MVNEDNTTAAQGGDNGPGPEDKNTEELQTAGTATEMDADHLLEDARARADEHWNQLLRAQADMENLRKRSERDLENAYKYGLEKFTLELLPVRDSMELGLAAVSNGPDDVTRLHEGMELTLKMLASAMEKYGISPIDPLNEPFDPDYHQAMSMVERPDCAPNTVVEVMQKGYRLHDRLIRPAMVVVSRAATDPETTPDGGESSQDA